MFDEWLSKLRQLAEDVSINSVSKYVNWIYDEAIKRLLLVCPEDSSRHVREKRREWELGVGNYVGLSNSMKYGDVSKMLNEDPILAMVNCT